MRRAAIVAAVALGWAAVAGAAAAPPSIRLDVTPEVATVGDPLSVVLQVELDADARLETAPLGPELGPFRVLEGDWSEAETLPDGRRLRRWTGTLAAYETGELTLPEVTVRVVDDAGGGASAATSPVTVRVESVLDPAEAESADLAPLKDPVGIDPDYRPLALSVALLLLLLALAGLALWLVRRRAAARSTAAAEPSPFERVDPYAWAMERLRALERRGLPEREGADVWFEELGRIVKRYLGGRFRVDLMERTTDEIARPLRLGGAGPELVDRTRALLEACDRVKFAGDRPEPAAARAGWVEAREIVETSRPALEAEVERPRGAA